MVFSAFLIPGFAIPWYNYRPKLSLPFPDALQMLSNIEWCYVGLMRESLRPFWIMGDKILCD